MVETTIEHQPAILVVDDEAPVRHFLRVLLERLGYSVDTATGGPDALRKASVREYDVVLTDLIMPRMDGLEVIRRVKEQSPETQVVMITGYPSSETIIAATRAGALDYLPKSPDPEHLAVLVEKAMEVRALRRKAEERDIFARMARMDGLTELFTRSGFLRSLDAELNRAQRATEPVSVLLMGVSEPAEVKGDSVVRALADSMRMSCRNYDILARYDDQTFAVMAPATDHDGSQTLADRIHHDAVVTLGDCGVPGGVVVGGATYPLSADSSERLIERAEAALTVALEKGDGTIFLA